MKKLRTAYVLVGLCHAALVKEGIQLVASQWLLRRTGTLGNGLGRPYGRGSVLTGFVQLFEKISVFWLAEFGPSAGPSDGNSCGFGVKQSAASRPISAVRLDARPFPQADIA